LASHNAGFGLFWQTLEYNAESAGIQVIALNPSNRVMNACVSRGSVPACRARPAYFLTLESWTLILPMA